MIGEHLWTFVISLMRPQWEWTSTAVTVIAFISQDVARLLMLPILVMVWIKARRDRLPASSTEWWVRLFFRGLVLLILLEMIELVLKFFEVHAVCNAPEVAVFRAKRHPNMTAEDLARAAKHCEVFSDVYDFLLQLLIIALLHYVAWVTFSYLRDIVRRQRAADGSAGAETGDSDLSKVMVDLDLGDNDEGQGGGEEE